ncbi:ArsR/SmtB family transcription factor [Thermodesulfobacteriota bacterium]
METVNFFKALADITRLRLLNILFHSELSVNEIVSILDMGQSRVSRHLKILTDAGFLECRRDGVWAFYFVISTGPGREFIDSIKYLLDQEPLFREDILHAEHIVQDRNLETVRFFNEIASKWDLLKTEILGDFNLNDTIISEINECDIAVDLGCGTGELMEKLKTVANVVIGVDSSSNMLELARERLNTGGHEFDLRLGELEHLPLKNSEADCAVISMVLHHLPKPETVIAEICRVLRKNGTLIVVDYDKHEDEDMRKIYGDRWLGFSRDEVEDILTAHGFRINKIQSFNIQKQLTLNLFKSVLLH